MKAKSTLGRIISWRPFRARGIYADDNFEYRFTCPRCKSHNAVKAKHSPGNWFLEGNYVCADCGLAEYEQDFISGRTIGPITYYSDCFTRVEIQPPLF